VAGQFSDLRPRGENPWPTEPTVLPDRSVKVARLKFGGRYDPEPLAWERFARKMAKDNVLRVEFVESTGCDTDIGKLTDGEAGRGFIEVEALPESGAQLAVLSGIGRIDLGFLEKEAIKKYLDAGGTLVIDAVGGDERFAADARKMLYDMYGRDRLLPLSSEAKVFTLPAYGLEKIGFQAKAEEVLGRRAEAPLETVMIGDRPAVYFSAEDLTFGLLGVNSGTVYGYAPDTATAIMRNIALLASGE
jgi:hypothetical protein